MADLVPLAALSLEGVRPSRRMGKPLLTGRDWARESPYAQLNADVTMYLTGTRSDNVARMRRLQTEEPCPSPVGGRPHPRGSTWEEGCLTNYDDGSGAGLLARRGSVSVSVSFGKGLRQPPDKRQEQAVLEIGQALLESLAWDDQCGGGERSPC